MRADLVLTKATSVRLWRSGAFGNKLRSWGTLDAWRADGSPAGVALRVGSGPGAGRCAYDIESAEGVERTAAVWVALGASSDSLMVCEMAPSARTLVQGEYWNGFARGDRDVVEYDTFVHSFRHVAMREAMREAMVGRPIVSHGLRSRLILQQAMTPASHEDWRELCERYPDHLLEVSVYDCCLGDLPGRNALVWEVRRY